VRFGVSGVVSGSQHDTWRNCCYGTGISISSLYLLYYSLQREANTWTARCFATCGSGEWQERAARLLHPNSTLFRLHAWLCLHPPSRNQLPGHIPTARNTPVSSLSLRAHFWTCERPTTMDQRIFAQLDQLQRGARETQPRRQEYGQRHTTHTGYEYDEYDQAPAHYSEEDVCGDENMIPPDFNGTRDFKSFDPSIADRME
jgi:hypothetical protein